MLTIRQVAYTLISAPLVLSPVFEKDHATKLYLQWCVVVQHSFDPTTNYLTNQATN